MSTLREIYDVLVQIRDNGGGGIYEKGSRNVSGVTYYDITLSKPTNSPYLPYVSLASSGNIVMFNITQVTPSGFRVEFSAPFTGTIYYCVILQ